MLDLCRTKSRPQILHAVPHLQFETKISLPIGMKYWPEKVLADGMARPCRLGMCGGSCTVGPWYLVCVRSKRSNWTTDATHILPQPDHAGSAIIRYVSLGLPGFGSFEWDEPRGLAWLADWLVYGDIAQQIGISAHMLPAILINRLNPAHRVGNFSSRYHLGSTQPASSGTND